MSQAQRWWGDEIGRSLLNDLQVRSSLAIVGSRNADSTGLLWTSRVVAGALDHGLIVISGGARGIDERAHRSAIEGGGQSVAVLGCGLDHINRRHRSLAQLGVGLLSPFPDEMAARRWSFPRRNQSIAEIADLIIVIQASQKSGALSTARAALKCGKPVWVLTHLPDAPLHQGCLTLLAEGARALMSERCWLDEPARSPSARRSLAPLLNTVSVESQSVDKSSPALPPPDSALWRASCSTPRSLAQLALDAELSWADALTEATLLEIDGWLSPVIGGLYVRGDGQR